jgi:hypothetical protein
MTVLSKQDYIDSINVLLADNSSQQISPQDIRTGLTDLADSVHRMLEDQNVTAQNMSTPITTTTRMGVGALDKLSLAGRTSEDNSAFGYWALRGNYDGTSNTAIGAMALSCNLYGDHNVGVGHNALAGNITGSGNVGVGNFTGQSNKSGSFNIAIGHGAGNYIGQTDSYKFYLGAHAVDYTDICDSTTASGMIPLLFGDLENKVLGVGVNTLHGFGAVQTSGSVNPSENNVFALGHGSYGWEQAYINSGILYPDSGNFYISSTSPKGGGFPDQYDSTAVIVLTSGGNIGLGTTTPSGAQGLVTVGGSIVPSLDGIYRVGTPGLRFDGFFNDLHASGNVTMDDINYNSLNEAVYDNMSFHMAVSGTGDPLSSGFINNALYGYLPDGSLNGGGFFLHSAGVGYQRDYQFIFTESDQAIPVECLEVDNVWSRSHWKANISLKVDDGLHVQTQRVLGDDKLSLVTQSGCNGVFVRNDFVGSSGSFMYFGEERNIADSVVDRNFTFYAPSGGGLDTAFVSIASSGSDRSVGLDLATRIESGVNGFQIIHNDSLSGLDRLTFNRTVNDGTVREHITMDEVGNVGITDKFRASGSPAYYPTTNLEVVSSGDSTEFWVHNELLKRSIFSLTSNNGPSGMRMVYDAADDYIDFSTTMPSGADGSSYHENGFITVNRTNNYIGLGQVFTGDNSNRVTPNSTLTIYNTGGLSGTVAMKEQETKPSATADFGKVYVKQNVLSGQTQSVFFLDDGGNEFDLTTGGDGNGTHAVDTYSLAVGSGALASVTSSSGVIAIGWDALENATSPDNSLVIGTFAANSGTDMQSSVVLGPRNLEHSTSGPSGIVLIGTKLYYNTTIPNNTLAIGHGSTPLLTGNFNTRSFKVEDGDFSVGASNDTTVFSIDHQAKGSVYDTVFDVEDTVNASSVSGLLKITFTDASATTDTLVTLNHQEEAMTNTPSYVGPSTTRPYMQLEGDLQMRGSLLFADGTYIDTADGRAVYGGTGISEDIVGNGTLFHLNYTALSSYSSYVTTLNNLTSYISMDIDTGGGSYKMSRIALSEVGALINSGDASVGTNCNFMFTDNNTVLSNVLNSGTVFIGCGAGVSATGWKNTVMIGTEAGADATTPNIGLATDTNSIFIGYRAGKDADNVSNVVAIGTNAGNEARNAGGSIFIGQNAGYNIQVTDSIGIGPEALRGTAGGGGAGGDANIEIVAGLLNSERLMYQKGNLSNRLNIQNTIAGHMGNRRVSIGDGILSPDAPLSVRRDSTIPGHSGTPIQTWYCEDVKVAEIDCDGDLIGIQNPQIIEGFTDDLISCPSGYNTPTSGIIHVRGADFVTTTEKYITHRDPSYTIGSGVLVIAGRVNKEYRPINIGCSGV